MTREQMIDLAVHNTVWEGLAYRCMTRAFFRAHERDGTTYMWIRLFGRDVQDEFRRIVRARHLNSPLRLVDMK